MSDQEKKYYSFPLFYCQHLNSQWICPFYKKIEDGFYSINVKCAFLLQDNESCFSEDCQKDSLKKYLTGKQ